MLEAMMMASTVLPSTKFFRQFIKERDPAAGLVEARHTGLSWWQGGGSSVMHSATVKSSPTGSTAWKLGAGSRRDRDYARIGFLSKRGRSRQRELIQRMTYSNQNLKCRGNNNISHPLKHAKSN